MSAHRFPELERLITKANRLGAQHPNSADQLAAMIHLVTESGADPYTVAGILIEGAVHAVTQHVPPAERADTARASGTCYPIGWMHTVCDLRLLHLLE